MSEQSSKITPFVEYVAESTTACLVTMVQGNLLALTVSHLVIASQTGVIAGVLAAAGLLIAKTDNRWIVSLVLGVVTAIVDYFVHPAMFGPVFVEAAITGVGAAVLSYLAGTLIRVYREKRVSAG